MKTQLPNTTKTTKGFTLIELMIVIAIIAVLSIIGITIYNGQQLNARNNRRKEDINAIANALETNKGIGSATYSAIYTTSFSSGLFPKDPNTGTVEYCGSTTSGTVLPVNAWGLATCSTSNGTGGTGTGGAGANFGTAFNAALTTFGGASSFWAVCASIEPYGTPGGGVYCRQSSQS